MIIITEIKKNTYIITIMKEKHNKWIVTLQTKAHARLSKVTHTDTTVTVNTTVKHCLLHECIPQSHTVVLLSIVLMDAYCLSIYLFIGLFHGHCTLINSQTVSEPELA